MGQNQAARWQSCLLFVGCRVFLEIKKLKGKKRTLKPFKVNLFKGWNIVTRKNLSFLPSLHCGQFVVNRPGIQGSFDLVEFLTALKGSHTK